MVTAKINGHIVQYYDDIEELPVVAFHKFQRMMLVDAGIGGDLASFDQRTERVRRFLALGKQDEAKREMENLRQCFFFILNNLSPKHRAFACLVVRIDGKEYGNSDGEIDEKLELLQGASKRELDGTLVSAKKKIDEALTRYFPKLFESSEVKEYYDLLKRRTIIVLEAIAKGEAIPNTDDLNARLICYSNPKDYANGFEVEFDRQFENLCLSLADGLNVEPKKMTVLEFYNAFDFLSERNKKANARQK